MPDLRIPRIARRAESSLAVLVARYTFYAVLHELSTRELRPALLIVFNELHLVEWRRVES